MLGKVAANVMLACVLTALAGCSSDGSDGANGRPGSAGPPGIDGVAALIDMVAEPPGSNCASGGSRIDSGLDDNANGQLEAAEIVGSQYVCNGSGSSSAQSLIAISDEPAGTNCPNGGERFSAGRDTDTDGVLDSAEITSTGYACDGTDGIGSSRILLALVSEAAGANCTSGGVRVNSGPDGNGNNALDSAEIVSTQYVCNGGNGSVGAPGQSALIATVVEPAGSNCNFGGTRISAGSDTNGNGTLEPGEATATAYACNGAPGPGITWVEVAANAVQTAANTGYLVNIDTEQAVLTLPAAPTIGSVVQISGLGRGGWKIAQNAGQYVVTSSLPGGHIRDRSVQRESARDWRAMACSADCNIIAAAVDGGQIYKSLDGGVSWLVEESNRAWRGIAASADGRLLYAVAANDRIYKGDDTPFYPNWLVRESVRSWQSIASSTDGSKVVAVAAGDQIFTSSDSGNSWSPRDSIRNWNSVASSADGIKLVAAVRGGQLYTSVDSGVTWTARESNRNWWGVASSADGVKLVATDSGAGGFLDGHIFTSTDSGVTWTLRGPDSDWSAITSSADGTRLTAGAFGGGMLYTSVNSGVTWTSHPPFGVFTSIASSADGIKLVAAGYGFGSPINVSSPISIATTTTGTAGSIIGGQHDAIAFQYVGGGKFIVLNHAGTFVVE